MWQVIWFKIVLASQAGDWRESYCTVSLLSAESNGDAYFRESDTCLEFNGAACVCSDSNFWGCFGPWTEYQLQRHGVTAAFVIYPTYMPGIHFCFKWLTRLMTEWRNGFEHHLVILHLFVLGPISSRGRPDVSLNISPIIMIMTCHDHKMKINCLRPDYDV